MVKFRGIEVSIISQFDIRRLSEFELRTCSPLPPTDHRYLTSGSRSPTIAIASCYVPIYPGSQIWFEYCIDGPHPPRAAYFFKFLLDGKVVTSWDCTDKHEYHGKMMYNLSCEGCDSEHGQKHIARQAMKFASDVEDDSEPGSEKDVIEIRIHRIEHRKRIRNLDQEISKISISSQPGDSIQLCNSGFLEQELPCRRYKYQLLDPVDEPYATFRFYCRTFEFLEKYGIIQAPRLSSWSPASLARQGGPPSPTCNIAEEPVAEEKRVETPPSTGATYSIQMVSSPSDLTESTLSQEQLGGPRTLKVINNETYLPPSDSEESLSIVTRDSIEDLPSSVPRSPKSSKFATQTHTSGCGFGLDTSPTSSPPLSPRRRLKKKLTININGADFDVGPKRRPLSPFTSGGMLRKLTGGVPPSAPAAVTEFGPTLDDEIRERFKLDNRPAILSRTTRAERSGRSLIGFLGRRLGSTSMRSRDVPSMKEI